MAKQRYVQDSFWTDPYVEKLDPSEKLLFIYYLTNPLCNIAGMYEIRNSRVAYETGFDKEMVDKIKTRFVNDGKMIIFEDWVIIVNFVKNQSTNPSVIQGIQRILDNLPSKVVNILTPCIQEGGRLFYFTLLNLTLLNSTLPGVGQGGEPPKTEVVKPEANPLIPVVIKAMEDLDPKNKLFYGNKTQRGAVEFLIKEYTFDKVIKLIKMIPEMKMQVPYFPSITTPVELRDKWKKVEDALIRVKVNTESKKTEVIFGN